VSRIHGADHWTRKYQSARAVSAGPTAVVGPREDHLGKTTSGRPSPSGARLARPHLCQGEAQQLVEGLTTTCQARDPAVEILDLVDETGGEVSVALARPHDLPVDALLEDDRDQTCGHARGDEVADQFRACHVVVGVVAVTVRTPSRMDQTFLFVVPQH